MRGDRTQAHRGPGLKAVASRLCGVVQGGGRPTPGDRAWAHLPLVDAQRVPRERGDIAFLQQLLAAQLPAADHVVAEHKLAMGANPGQLVLEWES